MIAAISCSLLTACDLEDSSSGDGYGAQSACHKFVKNQLKAPSTADFSDESGYSSDTGPWTITGYVDAENSFGAKLRTGFTCEIHLDSDDYYRGNATLDELP